ncbi:hypothetical protein LY76DRAFT_648653 [Colletotrichum caudatum]|nr:hypothetical protein LY76DRAFT_648653 [Colletotrichum caudatum]
MAIPHAAALALAVLGDINNPADLTPRTLELATEGASIGPGSASPSLIAFNGADTGHGTILANMIVRVNPWVELYAIKVQDEASRSGAGRNIFARSAAKAIEAAVDLQAHDIEALERAIDLAAGKGILMFCSASDDIQAGAMDTLPYQKQPEDVRNIDYYFPGNQVAEAKNPRSAEPVEYHVGSNMKQALDNVKSSKWEDPKYLPVWDVFGNRADWIKDAANEEEKRERLGKLVDQLGVGIED